MKIAVIGTGYVGLVTGACFADLGVHVVCVDVDAVKIARLCDGEVPIYEPGLQEIIRPAINCGRLSFTTVFSKAIAGCQVVFIAVGTPSEEDGSADLSRVLAAAQSIGHAIDGFTVVVNKSTVPVGTADKVREKIARALAEQGKAHSFAVVSNPEFLKEGSAIADFMRPDRILLGLPSGELGHRAKEVMDALYAPLTRNHRRTVYMDIKSAELTKYATNAMLATRISFMNELANLADRVGADIEAVRQGMGADRRIGYDFLYAGIGYGGSCLPKDIRAISHTAREQGMQMQVIDAVERVNKQQKLVLLDKITARFGENLAGLRFAFWGLAFKPNTDDMRGAPSRDLIVALIRRGAHVTAYDPVAQAEAARVLNLDLASAPSLLERLSFARSAEEATEKADALVIVTEWKAFRSPDFSMLRRNLKATVVFDGRNLYAPESMLAEGLEYHGIGRGTP